MQVITLDENKNSVEIKIDFSFPDVFAGMSKTEQEEREKYIREQEEKAEREKRLIAFRHCGIGELYWGCDLHNFKTEYPMQEKMLVSARKYFNNVIHGQISNLVLLGEAGRGKTTLAVGLLKQFTLTVKEVLFGLNQYYTVLYITSKDLCYMLQKTQSFSYGKSWDKILNDFAFYDVVVIDEVGKATVKNEFEFLFSFFDKRMQNKKSSIVCSNLTYDEFNTNMSDYGMSRLNVNGNLILVNVEGIPDLRQERNY